MKKIFLLFCFIFSLCFALNANAIIYEDQTIQRAEQKAERYLYCGSSERPILVAGYMNYPPFGWKEYFWIKDAFDGDVKLVNYKGIGIEIFKRFAQKNKLNYRFVDLLNHDEARYALTKGYFDVLVGNYYDANTYSVMNYFYPAYISNPIIIVTLKTAEGETAPETLQDLQGKKGFIRSEENLFELIMPQVPNNIQIKKVNGASRAYQALLRKEIDFLITSKYAHETEVRRFKIKDFVSASNTSLMSPFIFMSYANGNQCAAFIKDALEKELKEVANDENALRSILSGQLLLWENKFINQKSLMYETETLSEDQIESTKNLDAWLEQRKEEERRKLNEEDATHSKKPRRAGFSNRIGI